MLARAIVLTLCLATTGWAIEVEGQGGALPPPPVDRLLEPPPTAEEGDGYRYLPASPLLRRSALRQRSAAAGGEAGAGATGAAATTAATGATGDPLDGERGGPWLFLGVTGLGALLLVYLRRRVVYG